VNGYNLLSIMDGGISFTTREELTEDLLEAEAYFQTAKPAS